MAHTHKRGSPFLLSETLIDLWDRYSLPELLRTLAAQMQGAGETEPDDTEYEEWKRAAQMTAEIARLVDDLKVAQSRKREDD